MRKFLILTPLLLLALVAKQEAQEAPKAPAKEHEFLKQFVGEWITEAEMVTEPGKPAVKCKGTESCRLLGGFWLISEMKSEFMGTPVTGIMSIGYDTQKKKYVGTWVCSMCDWLCQYNGKVSGQVLTLDTEGPNPSAPDKTCKMRDVIEMKSKDLKTITSEMQMDNGQWVTFMTMTARRK